MASEDRQKLQIYKECVLRRILVDCRVACKLIGPKDRMCRSQMNHYLYDVVFFGGLAHPLPQDAD